MQLAPPCAVTLLRSASPAALSTLVAAAIGCGSTAALPVTAGTGPAPALPAPAPTIVPLVNVAPAKGWRPGATPVPAPALRVNLFASGLDHPRWLYVLPNGDVLVAETNAPARPDDAKGVRGWAMKRLMKTAGAGVPSADRITLLRDADGDGVAELRTVFAEGLRSPFGMALVGDAFYVANTDAVVRFTYADGVTRLSSTPS